MKREFLLIKIKMSESKSEMTAPVGNLKNRIDNNLKLSIPKANVNFIGSKNHPSTAPASSGRKNQFGDLPLMKNFMKNNWDCDQDMSEIGEDDYFVTTPGSIMSASSLNRKNNVNSFTWTSFKNNSISEHSPLISQFMESSTPTELSPLRFMKLSPILQEQEVSLFRRCLQSH